MEGTAHRVTQEIARRFSSWLLIGFVLATVEARTAEPVQFARAVDGEVLFVTGQSDWFQKDGPRPVDLPSSYGLGILDPLVESEVEWVLDLASVEGSTWLGIYNGAFYFLTSGKTLTMIELDSGSLVSLATVHLSGEDDGVLIGNLKTDGRSSSYTRYDLRRRAMRVFSFPTLEDEDWRQGDDSPKGLHKLYYKIDFDVETQSLRLRLRIFDLATGTWGIERITYIPLSSLPFDFGRLPQNPVDSSKTNIGFSSEHSALIPQWHDDHNLLLRAPNGLRNPENPEVSAPSEGPGLWILNVRTGKSFPIKFEATPLGELTSGGGGGRFNGYHQSAIVQTQDGSYYRGVPTSGRYSYRQPQGPFYARQRSPLAGALLCGRAALYGSVVIRDRNRSGFNNGEERRLYLSPSETRIAFTGENHLLTHDLFDGSVRIRGKGLIPIAWVEIEELNYVPGEAEVGEVPFSVLGTAAGTMPHTPFIEEISNRRTASTQLKLEAAFHETQYPETTTASVTLTITNEGKAGAWLLPPGSPMALRGTLIAPSNTRALRTLGVQTDGGETPQYVAPGKSLISKIDIPTFGEGTHVLIPGYHIYDQTQPNMLVSGKALQFDIGQTDKDFTLQRILHLIESKIAADESLNVGMINVLRGFAISDHEAGLMHLAAGGSKETRKERIRAERELLIYPSRAASALKQRILSVVGKGQSLTETTREIMHLYMSLYALGVETEGEFILDRLENGTPPEQGGVILLLETIVNDAKGLPLPYQKLLDVVRKVNTSDPSMAINALMSFLRRMPDSYDAEDLLRPYLDDPQISRLAEYHIMGHRASLGLPLDEESETIIRERYEERDGEIHSKLLRSLAMFYETDPSSYTVRRLMDQLLPKNRKAVRRYSRPYSELGSAWLRHAAAYPIKERLVHGRTVIAELEQATGHKLGDLPEGTWSEIEKDPNQLQLFENTLMAWARHIDANELDVHIP